MRDDWVTAAEARAIAGSPPGCTTVYKQADRGQVRSRREVRNGRSVMVFRRTDVERELIPNVRDVFDELDRLAREWPGMPHPIEQAEVGDLVQASEWDKPRTVLQANDRIAATRAPGGYVECHHHDELEIVKRRGKRAG